VRAIYGLYPLDAGTMRLGGAPWRPRGPADALRRGIVYLPEERKRQSLVLDHDLGATLRLGFSDRIARCGIVPVRAARERVARAIARFGIRATSARQRVGTLSGGNQQKAILARWLERDPGVILLDEPTRGIDVGSKEEIHALIDRLAAAGKAIVLVSSDLPELIASSDRIIVVRDGRVATELEGTESTQEAVLRAASGIRPEPADGGAEPSC
jgi:ABC-type sugar transport system ATPase subunit